ncbi:hypothetical protein [Paenibacillus albidus]|uniref:hypothetical protein n=1 Tax=Paenibacillus albidus TaxID=2041023 RepID=UPI001BE75734|nr:hypothetical protein [Paenibacillus albidus]
MKLLGKTGDHGLSEADKQLIWGLENKQLIWRKESRLERALHEPGESCWCGDNTNSPFGK